MPIDPPPTDWHFFIPEDVDPSGLVAYGADMQPATLLNAYRAGLFPMPVSRRRLGWFSPNPRGVLPIDGLHVSRSLRRSARRFEVRVDTAFEATMRACGDERRPHGWIDEPIIDAYCELYRLGWAHSFEVWLHDELVGGLYGVHINRFFAGESMFHTVTDASKVAMMASVDWLRAAGVVLYDVQWTTPHLASMGVVDVPRNEYLNRLADAVHM
jgi:leucyl/phenylalanyl-tRNA--protein transferase